MLYCSWRNIIILLNLELFFQQYLKIDELVLLKTKHVMPLVLKKRNNITNELYPFAIKDINPITTPYLRLLRERKMRI